MAEPFGQVEQGRRELDEPVADAGVGMNAGERCGLRGADASGVERFGETGHGVAGGCEPALAGDVGVRPVAGGAQVALHRAVPVGEVDLTLLGDGDGERQLGVDLAAQEFEGADPLVEFRIGRIDQLARDPVDRPVGPAGDRIEQIRRHAIHGTEGVSQSCARKEFVRAAGLVGVVSYRVVVDQLDPFLDRARCREIRTVDELDAMVMARRLAAEEGLLCGTSTGLNVAAALALASELGPGRTVVTLGCDSGTKYLQGELFASPA